MNKDGLKFRVFDKKENKYSEFSYYLSTSGALYQLLVNGDLLEMDEKCFVTELCLGLKDKKGNLIYEGDVLEKTLHKHWSKTSAREDLLLYKKRKKDGLIVEEKTDDKFNKLYYVFRTGETDVATMDRFPSYWLKNEDFGWEGEDLQVPEDWVIVGNIHEMEVKK